MCDQSCVRMPCYRLWLRGPRECSQSPGWGRPGRAPLWIWLFDRAEREPGCAPLEGWPAPTTPSEGPNPTTRQLDMFRTGFRSAANQAKAFSTAAGQAQVSLSSDWGSWL